MEVVKCQRMLEYCDTKAFLPVQSNGSRAPRCLDVGFLALLLDHAMAQNRNAEAQVMSSSVVFLATDLQTAFASPTYLIK